MEILIKGLLKPLLFLLFFGILAYLFPRGKSKITTEKDLSILSGLYQGNENRANAIVSVFAFIFGIPLYFIFGFIANLVHAAPDTSGIFVTIDPFVWIIPSILLGIIGGGYVSQIYLQKTLHENWEEYIAFQNLKYKVDMVKSGQYLAIFIFGASVVFSVLLLNFYSSFTEEDIRIHKFFSLSETEYQYSDVEKIQFFDYTEEGRRIAYIDITFKDGYKWHSVDNGFNDLEKDSKIVALIKRKSSPQISYEITAPKE